MDNSLASFFNIFRQGSRPDTLNVSIVASDGLDALDPLIPSPIQTTNEQQRNRQSQSLFFEVLACPASRSQGQLR